MPDLKDAKLDNKSLSYYVLTDADLTRAELREASLIGAALQGAVLYKADLLRANFSFAQLNEANLQSAAIHGANFQHAILDNADLSWSDLVNANFTWARLHEVNLANAQLGGCTFGFNDLSTVRGLDTVRQLVPSAIGINTLCESIGKMPDGILRRLGVPSQFIELARSLAAPPQDRFYSCFISHSSTDKVFAERIYATLRGKGVKCYYAPVNLGAGDRFRSQIHEAIYEYDRFLLILSENSIASTWVDDEVETALAREREHGVSVVLPIKLDDAAMETRFGWVASIKHKHQIGDFRDWKRPERFESAFIELMSKLSKYPASAR